MLVVDDATVWRDADFAVGECVEGIDGFVGAGARREMDKDFDLGGRVVIDLADLDFTLLVGFQDAFDERRGRFPVGYFCDDERLVVEFLDLCTHLDVAAAHAVVVSRDIDASAGEEVGIEVEILAVEVVDGRVADFAQIMW
ncbi:unknown [Prevotella sp. CAG:755]|nr:unknown [Prevotella sp. CAG:755]